MRQRTSKICLRTPDRFAHYRWFAALLAFICLAQDLQAATAFISGARITRGAAVGEVSVQFACSVEYVDHFPVAQGDSIRIRLESTSLCTGVSPRVAQSREQFRPLQADLVGLREIDYDGSNARNQFLTLVFDKPLRFDVVGEGTANTVTVRLYFEAQQVAAQRPADSGPSKPHSVPPRSDPARYAINLSSSRERHSDLEKAAIDVATGLELYESRVSIGDTTWYRLRLGDFDSTGAAQVELRKLRSNYPTAWIDRSDAGERDTVLQPAAGSVESSPAIVSLGLDEVDNLMNEARLAMVATEYSRAVQLYTKILRAPHHDRHAEAQEFLGLAREKNEQTAHARAEYEKYLEHYADGDGAARVKQRLAALLAVQQPRPAVSGTQNKAAPATRIAQSDWRVQTYMSQYYRRDVNQLSADNEIVSQSALYTDANLDIRRRGRRFDIGSRISAGYRSAFGDEASNAGNDLRVSYAYIDLSDTTTALHGRLGRQTRNTGGVLGRFDGLNMTYDATELFSFSGVVGMPVNSASDRIDADRSFYGASIGIGPLLDNLDLGLFYLQQQVEGIDDRRSIGAEFRYFGEKQSIWGLLDYDTLFKEIGSAYVQASWRLTPRTTVHAALDRRRSPYLSTSNALVGQPVTSFSELAVIFSADELRQLGLDRSAESTSWSAGLSQSLSPRFQLSLDANMTRLGGTPESGGVAGTPPSTFQYYAANLTASSLFRENDVSIVGLRYSTSDTYNTVSLNADTRVPIGEKIRLNPRLRVDRRERLAVAEKEWLISPGMRLQLRWSRKLRMDLEIGRQFTQQDSETVDIDRESWFVNVGYQVFF